MATDDRTYLRHLLVTVGVLAGSVLLVVVLWYAVDVLLLVFAGVLIAVLLRAPANYISRHTPLSGRWSVVLVLLLLMVFIWLAVAFAADPVMEQFDSLSRELPQKARQLKQEVIATSWGERLVDQWATVNWGAPRMNVVARITGALSTAFGVVTDVAIICFLGLYFALQPEPYLTGIVGLLPQSGRTRAREVLDAIKQTLQAWLVGKLISMAAIAVLTWGGLSLIGVPLALALALLAGIFSFVPYIGPILSAVPAVLLALSASPHQALYVAFLYLGVQAVESNVLTPFVQQRAVDLPAAMILTAQLVLGVLVGGLGVVLATPVAATVFVLVKKLYVEDFLGEGDARQP